MFSKKSSKESVSQSESQVTLVAKDSVDVIDRFFGFTERMVCSADKTTNVILDPVLLQKEEESGFICGKREQTADDEVFFAGMCNLMDKITEEAGLEKKGSEESGNTEIETMDGTSVQKRSKNKRGLLAVFGFFAAFMGCNGREEVVQSVILTEAN